MTNETILKKAIEKAVKGGWNAGKLFTTDSVNDLTYDSENVYEYDEVHHYTRFIFDHDFAKAFFDVKDAVGITQYSENTPYKRGWEIDAKCLTCGMYFSRDDIEDIRFGHKGCKQAHEAHWQYHLQQMVLEKDPIKYLEKFL